MTGLLQHGIAVGDVKTATRLLEWTSALAASSRPWEKAVDRLVVLAVQAVWMKRPVQALSLVLTARNLARAERQTPAAGLDITGQVMEPVYGFRSSRSAP
ncbi:hypothetical protein [Lentzea kentuckyensis]|uniref:hypothetical protein n=1 Tax=Lentzea kentuckyensis TaxID=360086 RepID=UPI00117ABAE2|nr:hypothetical protein [Lentzea kentuckyensis]